jgi:hypothetical protein
MLRLANITQMHVSGDCAMLTHTNRSGVAKLSLLFISLYFVTACGGGLTIGHITFGKQRAPSTVITVANTNPAPRSVPSQNWAGYATRHASNVTKITSTWQVPQVTNPDEADSSTWIGIGGIESSSLIQAGTDQLLHEGKPYYYAWIEALPAPPQRITDIDLLPGDTITVTIAKQQGNQWNITMNDHDAGQSVTKKVTYASCLCSAEWIEEAPSINGKETQLANFTSATFTKCAVIVAGQQVTPSMLRSEAISMITPQGKKLVEPQVLADDTFSVVDVADNV